EIFAALREAYIAGAESKDIIYENVESWALAADGENNIIFNNREGELLVAPLQTTGLKLPVINKGGTLRLSGAPGAILQVAAFAGKYDDDRLFCGAVDGNLFYWQKNKWEKRNLPAKYNSKILAMVFSKNKNALFYSVKNTIYIYRLTADQMPEPIISADEHDYILAMVLIEEPGTGASFLIAGDENGNIYRVDISGDIKKNSAKKLNTALNSKGAGFHALAYEPGRKLLALADSRGGIHLFPGIDAKTPAAGNPIPYYTFERTLKGIVNVLAFSPGGKYLASGGLGGSIMLWDLNRETAANIAKQAPALTITGKQKILSLVFDPKEEYIVFNDELSLRICPTRPGVFFQLLCRGKNKGLSPQEWKHYIGESIKQEDIAICSHLEEK
ncbi:MAG: family ATPase, partial [Acidobacteriota bacterium]|nr:family ATPase [Acidobacteriota bacterium]